MNHPPTPEEALGSPVGKPLSVGLCCDRCQSKAKFEVPWVVLDPTAARGPDDKEGVLLARIFTCPSCGAVDEYTLAPATYRRFSREAMVAAIGEGAGSSRVLLAKTELWDGTPVRRPSQGLARLRALTIEQPQNPEAWRRLGNFCERYGLPEEAERMWRKAVAVGPDEFEAAYSLAEYLLKKGTSHDGVDALRYLFAAIDRFPRAREFDAGRRNDFAGVLANMLFELADHTVRPVVLMAGWTSGERRGEPVVRMSSVDLRRVRRREGLAEFLARPEVMLLRITDEVPADEATQLLHLLESGGVEMTLGDDLVEDMRVHPGPVRAAPRAGRNDPCPCGSGKKYKKCHGA